MRRARNFRPCSNNCSASSRNLKSSKGSGKIRDQRLSRVADAACLHPGITETLLDGAVHDPEHNVRFLSIIRQNAERLGRLTADLMTLSRLELKTTRFQFASYYARDLSRTAAIRYGPSRRRNVSRLYWRGPRTPKCSATPKRASGDEQPARQRDQVHTGRRTRTSSDPKGPGRR